MRILILLFSSLWLQAVQAAQESNEIGKVIMNSAKLGQVTIYSYVPDLILLDRTDFLTLELRNSSSEDAFALYRKYMKLYFFIELQDASGARIAPLESEPSSGDSSAVEAGRRDRLESQGHPSLIRRGRPIIQRFSLGKRYPLREGEAYSIHVRAKVGGPGENLTNLALPVIHVKVGELQE